MPPPPDASSPASELPTAGPASPPPQLNVELTAGGGIVVPTPSTLSLLLTADASLFVTPRWRFGLLAAFSLGGPTTILDDVGRQRGTLQSQALSLLPHAMACLDTALTACAGLRAGPRLAIGSASGPFVFQTRTRLTTSVSAGPAVHLAISIGAFVISLDSSLLFNSPSQLGIDGLSTIVSTPLVEFLVHLGVGGKTR